MKLVDSRRLTGPNLYSNAPGAIAEVEWLSPGRDPAPALAQWRGELARMLDALGWHDAEVHARAYLGGAALFFTAPIDSLLPATDVNEWAVESAAAVLAGGPASPLEPARTELAAAIATAHQPGLAELAAAARAHRVSLLVDDDAITLGSGRRLVSYPSGAELPAVTAVPWAALGRIPIALITGTNGKTTSTRLVARMARLAGLHPGNTSSDGVSVDEQFIERGDWSGPDGARRVLRHADVDLAVLEVARGGILRRGLAVDACDAALITNVTVDHLGGYGVDDLATMAQVKAVIGRIAGTVVLNADDPELVALTPSFGRVVYFSADADNPVTAAHRAAGGEAWLVRDGELTRARGDVEQPLIAVDAMPLSFAGRARYNIENALGAAALATALGLPEAAVVAGLRMFTSSSADNPGRGNLVEVGGVKVLVDFGHNPAAVRGVLALGRALIGDGRLFVVIGMPGDRPDDELIAVAGEIAAARPAEVRLLELTDYLRGREPGVLRPLMRAALVAAGVAPAAICDSDGEVIAVGEAVTAARPGDLVLSLTHLDDGVFAMLAGRG